MVALASGEMTELPGITSFLHTVCGGGRSSMAIRQSIEGKLPPHVGGNGPAYQRWMDACGGRLQTLEADEQKYLADHCPP